MTCASICDSSGGQIEYHRGSWASALARALEIAKDRDYRVTVYPQFPSKNRTTYAWPNGTTRVVV